MVTVALYAALGFVCIAVMLTVAIRSAVIGSDRSEKKRLFTTTVFCIAVACFSELVCNILSASGNAFPRWGMYALDIIYFMMIACSSCCWFFYVFVIRDSKFMYSRGRSFLCVLPFAALLVLLTVSCFTDGCIFYLDAEGVYHRGPLYIFQPVLSYGYLATAALHAFLTVMQKKYAANKRENLSLFICTVLCAACGGVQYAFPDVPLLSMGATLSVLTLFLDALSPMISLDSLTGIHNRRNLLTHIHDEVRYLRHGDRLHFLFLDVDSFKQINDIYGHAEGDRILKQIAAELKAFCLRHKCYCARYGGDELAVVQVLRQDEDIFDTLLALEEGIAALHLRVADSPEVRVSIGHAEYRGEGDSIGEMISRADKDMYRVKKEKQETAVLVEE